MNFDCLTCQELTQRVRPIPATPMDLLLCALIRERWTDFSAAKQIYKRLIDYRPGSPESQIARERIKILDILIAEKELYKRIDGQARQVLTRIGMNIANSPCITKLLLEAEGIDLNNETAPLVPLKPDYVDRCLDLVPKDFSGDPGPNTFGTGGTAPFFWSKGNKDLRPATRREFEELVHIAGNWSGVVDIFSLPVQTDKDMTDFDCALSMEKGFSGLKMMSSQKMTDEQTSYFAGKEDWLDGFSLMSNLMPMSNMDKPFMRSVRHGNNLLLLDFSISGASGPNTPEALLTFIHAQVLFMMILVQTIRPGTVCIHGGIPGVIGRNNNISYSSATQYMINEAMARLNLWVTGLPSAQSGGTTSEDQDLQKAIEESKTSREKIRRFGAHMVRHALGSLGNLNFFSLDKFDEDCKAEAASREDLKKNAIGDITVLPLYLPADDHVLEGIYEFAQKGNPRIMDHTLRNVDAFRKWEEQVAQEEQVYYHQTDTQEEYYVQAA